MKSIFEVLDARGIACTDDAGARIETCADIATLEAWLRRAATAPTLADVLAG